MTQSIAPVHFGGLEVQALDATGAPVALTSWLLHTFELEERIDEPFSLMLTVSTADLSLSAAGLVGGRCVFTFGRGDTERDIRGVVIKADTVGLVRGQLRLRLWVGPSLEILSLSRRMRVFQGMTAIEVVQASLEPVFEAYGGALDVERVGDMPLRVRDYCVQHDETDLQLVQRLLAEEGIAFSFCHDAEHATMVLLPSTACLHSAAGEGDDDPRPLQLLAREPDLTHEETLQRLEGSTRMRSASAEASVWDWKATPPAVLSMRQDPLTDDSEAPTSLARFGEVHEHEPYRPVQETEGGPVFEQVDLEATLAGRRGRIDDLRATGTSNAVGMTDGATFEVQHASPDLDGRYAVLTITHHAEFHDTEDGVANGRTASYSNHFTCHRYAFAFRCLARHRRRHPPPRAARPCLRPMDECPTHRAAGMAALRLRHRPSQRQRRRARPPR